MLEAGKVVVDLSGAFRLGAERDYATWYGFAHPSAALLDRAHYGLPELFGPPQRAPDGSALVASPGCYPTATLLALAPLLRAGLVEPRGIIIDAKSGVTRAGRQAKEEYSFAEVDEDVRAYQDPLATSTRRRSRGGSPRRPGVPDAAGRAHVHAAPPAPCGAGSSPRAALRPRAGGSWTSAAIGACLAEAYRGSSFVKVVRPEKVTLGGVVGTNEARVGAVANSDVVVAVASIDNLLKGAAGCRRSRQPESSPSVSTRHSAWRSFQRISP